MRKLTYIFWGVMSVVLLQTEAMAKVAPVQKTIQAVNQTIVAEKSPDQLEYEEFMDENPDVDVSFEDWLWWKEHHSENNTSAEGSTYYQIDENGNFSAEIMGDNGSKLTITSNGSIVNLSIKGHTSYGMPVERNLRSVNTSSENWEGSVANILFWSANGKSGSVDQLIRIAIALIKQGMHDQASIQAFLKAEADKNPDKSKNKDPKKANSTGLYEPHGGEGDDESGNQDSDLRDVIIVR
ncbi:hypothetical protein K1X76_09955 [bacterium]|nr:hypothetical protein [bacterium]